MVNTKAVQRRSLSFQSSAEVLAEVERIVAAEREGRLAALGNWETGQALGHLASWIGYAYDGVPAPLPWFMRALGPLLKGRMLRSQMPAGVRIPKAPEGTYGVEKFSTLEGARRLREAWQRLEREAPSKPNPLLGPLTHDQWRQLHLRHAALHLGFFRY